MDERRLARGFPLPIAFLHLRGITQITTKAHKSSVILLTHEALYLGQDIRVRINCMGAM